VQGHLIDLSARGVGVAMSFASDPNLAPGDVVDVAISAMMRVAVETPARVANIGQARVGHVRYGLEFLNVGNLYSQLDAFYGRFFNRRRNARVRTAFDEVVRVEMSWAGGEHTARVYDVSERGMGLAVPADLSVSIDDGELISLRFRLRGSATSLEGLARVRSDVTLERRRVIGLEFDLEHPGGLSRHGAALREYVSTRAAQMEAWEQAWSG
jgi:c-di-GMP-binding flagellar brake protein YcgR